MMAKTFKCEFCGNNYPCIVVITGKNFRSISSKYCTQSGHKANWKFVEEEEIYEPKNEKVKIKFGLDTTYVTSDVLSEPISFIIFSSFL